MGSILGWWSLSPIGSAANQTAPRIEHVNEFFDRAYQQGKIWSAVSCVVAASHFPHELNQQERASAIVQKRGQRSWRQLIFAQLNTLLSMPSILVAMWRDAILALDSRVSYSTWWERSLVLSALGGYLTLPYRAVVWLKDRLNPSFRMTLIVSMAISAWAIWMRCYSKLGFPILSSPYWKNLNREKPKNVIDLPELTNRVLAEVEEGNRLFIIGPSGSGKTTSIHSLIDKDSARKAYIQIACNSLMASREFNRSDLIYWLNRQFEHHEGRMVLVFDEIQALLDNNALFQSFKIQFLDRYPNTPILILVTEAQWQRIQELDADEQSIQRRCGIVRFPSAIQDIEFKKIIRLYWENKAPTLPIHDDAIEEIVRISKRNTLLPKVGEVGRAVWLCDRILAQGRQQNADFAQTRALEAIWKRGLSEVEKLACRLNTIQNRRKYIVYTRFLLPWIQAKQLRIYPELNQEFIRRVYDQAQGRFG